MQPEDAQILLTFIHGLGLMSLVAMAFGAIERLDWAPIPKAMLKGAAFGAGGLVSMASQVELHDGVLIDARSTFVGFAAAFSGWPGLLVASVIVGAARISMGGLGLISGLAGIVIAGIAGLRWRRVVRRRVSNRLLSMAILGIGIGLSVTSFVLLPGHVAIDMAINVAPYSFGASVIAALVLGSFIERERVLIKREARLTSEATTDPLTGLMNRRSFEAAMGQHERAGGALLVIDIDHFKKINDTFGHQAGDAVLRELGAVLGEAVRGSDLAARIGGEEFAVYLPHALLKDARRVAERIRASVEASSLAVAGGQTIRATVSVGAHWSAGPLQFDEMFRPADVALYRAKNSGRNRVEFASVLTEVQEPQPAALKTA